MKVTLSARQEKCLSMLIDGYRQNSIARELGITNQGVCMHLREAAQKLGVASLSGHGQVELFRIARVYFERGQPATSPLAGNQPASAIGAPVSLGDA